MKYVADAASYLESDKCLWRTTVIKLFMKLSNKKKNNE